MEDTVFIAFLLHVFCFVSGMSVTNQYANIGESVILKCQQVKGAERLRWIQGSIILTDGQMINKRISRYAMFTIDMGKDASQYNLMIVNVTADDLGEYQCESQIDKILSRQRVILIEKDLTSTKKNPTSREFQKHMTVSFTRSILTTLPNTENTVSTNYQKTNFGLIAAGFVVVLLVSIVCNICISNYRNRGVRAQIRQQKIELQNLKNADVSLQELESVGDISNLSSRYETIDENEMTIPDFKNHEHRTTLNRQLSSLYDQSYLEVIGDVVYSASDEVTIEPFSMSYIEMNKQMSLYPYTANNIDAEVASYHSTVSKQFDESDMSSASNSSIRVVTDGVSKFINKDNTIAEREIINPYMTLNTWEIDKSQSYYTALDQDMEMKKKTISNL